VSTMDVTIVCHCEFGRVIDRKIAFSKDTSGIVRGVPNLIRLADKHGAKVTFAVMPETARHFPRPVKHEIGLHVHPGWTEYDRDGVRWTIGDAYLKERCRQTVNSVGLMNYPYDEQLDMIETGKDHIEDVFGVEPRTFVAGTWSVNNDTIKALVRSGFRHDCSPYLGYKRSVYDWSKLRRNCLPYHPDERDYQEKGAMPLLIVPTSQMALNQNVSPEAAPVLGPGWLKACFTEYYRLKIPLFNICLHSPCMSDPYYIAVMDRLLAFIAKHEVDFRFISEIEEYAVNTMRTSIMPYALGISPELVRSVVKKVMPGRKSHAV
jgi:peptidoglycan/xylan/chitin deacetylase (PgdA/CDA1 family)